jgi:hypothetical protein
MRQRTVLLLFIWVCAVQLCLYAQDFNVFNRKVQIHGFASQGFVHTNENNWLTMNTSNVGSGEFTDFGANASTQITDRFRVGAQIYDRNLGQLGRWHPSLDWAFADYRFKPWLGIRGGKVKTTLGLYNDTQDLDFLRPFALLPQSLYSIDIRETAIAHTGGDVYGHVPLGKGLGTLAYTGYAGLRHDTRYGGYFYMARSQDFLNLSSYGGLQYGGDLHWTTPVKGLLVGMSRLDEDIDVYGANMLFGAPLPYHEATKSDWTNQYYGRYIHDKFQIASEYRRFWRDHEIVTYQSSIQMDVRGWYVAGAYRVAKRLQIGSYYSHYTLVSPAIPDLIAAQSGHVYDKAVSGRIDLDRFWNVKIEGHLMDGFGVPGYYPDGFYAADNPQGLKPNTNALVVKTGFNF